MEKLQRQLSGNPIESRLDRDPISSISSRISRINYESKYSSADPTGTHMMSLGIAQDELGGVVKELQTVLEEDMLDLREKLRKAGAPYVPNLIPDFKGK